MKKTTQPIPATALFVKKFGKLRQGIYYHELCGLGGRRFQIDIYRDSFDFQSHAKIAVWNGNEWNIVASLMYPEIEIAEKAIRVQLDETVFKACRDELVRRAAWICA